MTPERDREADAVETAFHIALTQIGAETAADAIKLWQAVPPVRRPGVAAAWLARAVHLIMTRRARARALALAYYRLVRALRTGSTIASPVIPVPRYVTLQKLRFEFEQLAGRQQAPQAGDPEDQPAAGDDEPTERDDDPEDEESEDDEADRILVEELADLEREQARLERLAEDEANSSMEAMGTGVLDRKVDEIDTTAPADEVDEKRDEAHRQAGARQAAAAARVVMDGARSEVWSLTQEDRRAIGYVRMSRTGTPCGWCAMLISRGPVYKSRRSAQYNDGDKYHDNCQCYAMPVFSDEQFEDSPMFAMHSEYMALWPEVTKGLSGKAALSAWRRFFRQQARAQAARSQVAQEA